MNTLDRYILREMFTVFLIAVFATTTLLYMDKFLLMAEMIVNRGVSFIEMLAILLFLSPSVLSFTIPISVLVASVVTFNQFSAHNEWVAMKSTGRSFLNLLRPVFVFSLLTYALANFVMFYALPAGNHAYKQLIFDIIRNRAAVDIKPRIFNQDFDNLILLVEERESDSSMKGIFIADTSRPREPQIIAASKGLIFSDPASLKIQLQLSNGTIHEYSARRGDYQTLNFRRYDLTLNLPDSKELERKATSNARDISAAEIREKMARLEKEGKPTHGLAVALSKKFALPFSCLLFALFGAPLGVKSSRSGKSGSFAMCLVIILLYYVALVFSKNMGSVGSMNPYLAMWIPNLVLLVAGVYVTVKMHKEIPFGVMGWVADALEDAYAFLKNFRKSTRPGPPPRLAK